MKSNMIKHIALILLLGVTTVAYAQTDRQLVREGNRFFTKGQYDKAEVQYRKAVEKNSSNPQALYNLGCALMMQNKDSAAIVQYQKAAKFEKNKLRLAGVYHNIGVVCQNHKMYGEAIKAYEQSLRNNPKDNETRYNLTLCKKLQKNNKQQDKDKNNDNNKQQNNKNRNNNKEKDKNKQKQPKEQMSKDNAEQLINAAIQNEKATQQRLKKALQKNGTRKISDKNW